MSFTSHDVFFNALPKERQESIHAKAMQLKQAYEKDTAKQARQAVGLSQKDFATLLGVSVKTLQAWEQGTRTPSRGARTLLKIAQKHPQILLSVI